MKKHQIMTVAAALLAGAVLTASAADVPLRAGAGEAAAHMPARLPEQTTEYVGAVQAGAAEPVRGAGREASRDRDGQARFAAVVREEAISNLNEEFTAVLTQSRRTFFAGYAIDESFLLWLDARYGDDVIRALADEAEQNPSNQEIWYELTGSTIHVLWLEYCRDLNYSSYLLSGVSWVECADDSVVTMEFIGDINFGEDWHTTKALDERGGSLSEGISQEILQELSSADITMANNEFTFGVDGTAIEGKKYVFRADPLRVSYYEQLGVDIVSLGNNHTWDYGEQGLLSTMETLQNAGIPYVGAGKNLNEAKVIRYFVANGRKIAVVSATQIERYHNYTKEATETSAGVLKTLDTEIFVSVIKEAVRFSDHVIVYVHWGTEGNLFPDAGQREMAEEFVAAGADIVIGGHSHRLQGMTYIEDVPVLYSLGNFWFSTGDLYATIVKLQITSDGELSLSFLPCEQKDLRVGFLTGQEEKDGFYEYIADLSKYIGIKEDGTVCRMLNAQEEGLPENVRYRFGMEYANRHGDVDLQGNGIDIVGNLK